MVDLDRLSIIQQAEEGDSSVCFKLNYFFSKGAEGFPSNYKMATYYIDKLKNSSDYKIPLIRFMTLCQEGDCERAFSNYDKAIIAYTAALDTMVSHLSFKEWDFKFLQQLSELSWMNNCS
ncbi:hypothetical protein LX87_05592 [Larkinella arboricola]|uniref:Sel1 repeat-containing protein n=2 Tax=Larkinella arboricola TaxID=643671 RepID=A0A327WJD3_LARAB|nr:hypothetical protein LX87_05592 [Larkinella arboricola]